MTTACFQRDDCRLCGSTDLEAVLELTPTPVGGNYLTEGELDQANDVYPLRLSLGHSCGYTGLLDVVEPDILFHSVDYLNEQNHKRYDNGKTKKVFYTGENQRPNFNETHFSFTFDYSDDSRNYRLPLWAFYLNWFNVPHNEERDQSYLHPLDDFLEKKIDIDTIRNKGKFCAFISSVAKGKRVEFVPKLHRYKPVACGGKLFNNLGGIINGRGDQKWKMLFFE